MDDQDDKEYFEDIIQYLEYDSNVFLDEYNYDEDIIGEQEYKYADMNKE